MKHYKDTNGNFFGFDALQHVPDGMVEVNIAEINQVNNAKAQSAFDALSYADKRRSEYPDFRDYLDGIVKGDTTQVQSYIDACLAVKAKYPKQ